MKSKQELIEMLKAAHKPELAKQSGMVYQVWEDGEVTLQKSGELLWQRNLHSIYAGRVDVSPLTAEDMPVKDSPLHGYAFVDRADAVKLHNELTMDNVVE